MTEASSFAARCFDGVSATESTRLGSKVSFETVITGSSADMGRKNWSVCERWTKVSPAEVVVGEQIDVLDSQVPLDCNDRQD